MPKKRQSLFPIEYDEISLVDFGGGESDDGEIAPSVLIMKRDVKKAFTTEDAPGPLSPRKKSSSSSGGSSSITSSSSVTSNPSGKKKKTDPCNPKSKTGKKTGKSSQRAKNWKGDRHPRQKGGKFGQSSSASKQKYGKGGTTKAKQQAECKRRHSSSGPSKKKPAGRKFLKFTPVNARAARAKGRRMKIRVRKWDTDAQLRALVERKAAR